MDLSKHPIQFARFMRSEFNLVRFNFCSFKRGADRVAAELVASWHEGYIGEYQLDEALKLWRQDYSLLVQDNEPMTDEWFEATFIATPEDMEMGLSTQVTAHFKDNSGVNQDDEHKWHILCVDFKTSDEDEAWRVATKVRKNPWLYKTGNSFHAYWPEVLTDEQWRKAMGKFSRFKAIDQMWVTLMLKRGFGVLRWSNYTERHQSMPVLVRGGPSELAGALTFWILE